MARSKQPTQLTPRYKLPPSPQLTRYLLRLSKPSLEKLVFDWLRTPFCAPNLAPTDEDLQYEDDPEDATVEEVEETYRELSSRKDIVERILEREWRDGLTMHQVAQVDMEYLLEHPSSLKWTASELVLEEGRKPVGDKLPKFQPVIFCKSLAEIMDPMVQCHSYFIAHPTLPLTLVRLSLHDPYPLPKIPPPPNQIFYLAVPTSSPYLFFTPQRSRLADICRKSLPIALSSQNRRYDIVSTALSAKTLEALIARKGHERGDIGAGGGWSVYAVEGKDAVDGSPLETTRPRPAKRSSLDADGVEETPKDEEGKERWKRKRVAEGRFGTSALVDDGSGLERVEVKLREVWPQQKALPAPLRQKSESATPATTTEGKDKGKGRGRPRKVVNNTQENVDDGGDETEVDADFPWKGKSWVPNVDVVLEGTHVFAGIRTLVEEGIFDGTRIPTWMTGEEGKSVGTVTGGTIVQAAAAGIQDPTRDPRRGKKPQ
ncbi:Inner kinetochore subunit mis15 [Drechslerella dactyloides]|uniref:Inner kinetochore subunit mis15 n=1 Tax=Drechslerella dactyloides TaxID=74499 RepID=A0AAD6ISK4_DREDA|nr:Inner kinetochore subunit mis15 [Drechslerella dactyloides]